MTDVSPVNPLLEQWSEDFRSWRQPQGPKWLGELRDEAAAQLRTAGLPGRKTEAWKYTPMRRLESLGPAIAAVAAGSPAITFPEQLPESAAAVLEISDGVLRETPAKLPAGMTALPLSAAMETFGEKLQPLLGSVDLEGPAQAFSALNTAFLDQGLVVHVGEQCDAGRLLLRWAFTDTVAPRMGNFRLVLLLEPGANLELVEQFESAKATENALNVVVQADLAEKAALRHVRVQCESEGAALFTSTSVEQAAESDYRYSGFDLGGGLVRHELKARLAGSGANAGFDGAFVLDRKRHVDNHVSVDHAAPACTSTQFFRGVLGGSSRGVFNGRALIRPGADESSVHQSNANLLLSPLAEMDTKPELEIYADEVEASHGATVGQLDETAVFYLRSRGLSEARARRMLTSAFCHAVTDRLGDRALADRIAVRLDDAMPDGGS